MKALLDEGTALFNGAVVEVINGARPLINILNHNMIPNEFLEYFKENYASDRRRLKRKLYTVQQLGYQNFPRSFPKCLGYEETKVELWKKQKLKE